MSIRLISETDSMDELTDLIHRAYIQLADMGLRYWATHQSVEDTRRRAAGGECYVVEIAGRIVGTIVLRGPAKPSSHPWYNRPDVAIFNQFAVDPPFQKQRVGSTLLEFVEKRAVEMGARELACDTAEGAVHLIAMYRKRGFRQVGTADWEGTNYMSVVLSKSLADTHRNQDLGA